MGNQNSTCTQDQIWRTQRCYVSPFASANPMCVDPDPTKCNSTTQLQTCDPGYYCAFLRSAARARRRYLQ